MIAWCDVVAKDDPVSQCLQSGGGTTAMVVWLLMHGVVV